MAAMQQERQRRRSADPPSDDVDLFHAAREVVPLDPSKRCDDDSEDSLLLDEIGPLSSGETDSSGADESEDGEPADGRRRLHELKQQERLSRSKAQLQRGEDSDGEELDSEPEAGWGARKKAYYGAEEDEGLEDEAAEAAAQQRRAAEALDDADYGIVAGSDSRSDSGEEEDRAAGTREVLRVSTTVPEYYVQLQAVPTVARAEALKIEAHADAPELGLLLESLNTALVELRTRIGPVTKEVREGSLATADGVSYLEVKNMLLLQYCMHLVFYLLLRTEGRSVKDHPVIARLVEIRLYMERLRPLDKKLHYQIEKLLSSHRLVQTAQAGSDADPGTFKPDPAALVVGTTAYEEAHAHAGDGMYRPPKLHAVVMEDDPDKDKSRRKKRAAASKARKSMRSDLIQDLAREVHAMPEEVREVRPGGEGHAAAQQRRRLEKRAEEEEDLMMRVPLGKQELKQLRLAEKTRLSGGAMMDDFADDVADLVQAAGPGADGSLSQRFGVDAGAPTRLAAVSGDADLPVRSTLTERRAMLDNARVRQSMQEADLLPMKRTMAEDFSEDEAAAYEAASSRAQARRAAKAARRIPATLPPPLEDEQVVGHRKITPAVDRNRGLTPHRRKDSKNPRVKGRKKFEKAKVRRKGQVVGVRKPQGPYAGEATGIRSKVSKSTRL